MVANDRNQLKEIVDQKIIVLRNDNAFRRMIVYAFICKFHNLKNEVFKELDQIKGQLFLLFYKIT